MPVQHYYTATDLLDFPEDGNKYEVVHGELLVSPSPRMRHQLVVGRLTFLLHGYLERFPVGEAFPGGDVHWGSDSMVIPDMLVVDREMARTNDWKQIGTPLLVTEVLSPSSNREDRFTKRLLYQEIGVPVYWLVDPDARAIEIWTPDAAFPVVEHASVSWHPTGAGEPLEISLPELFREV